VEPAQCKTPPRPMAAWGVAEARKAWERHSSVERKCDRGLSQDFAPPPDQVGAPKG